MSTSNQSTGGSLGEDRLVVIDPQPEAEAERGISQHERKGGPGAVSGTRPASDHLAVFAFAASHSALVISMNPLPLQEF